MAELSVDDPYLLTEAVRVPLAGPQQVDDALNRGRAAARAWRQTSVAERVSLCRQAMTELASRREEVAVDITKMMGKPLRQSRSEMGACAERAEYMASIAEEALAERSVPGREGFDRRIAREPLGLVFALPAWNYPLLTAVNVVFPAVLAGNAVLLKHSPRSPLCGDHFADAFRAAGAPDDLVLALSCDHATSEGIARDSRIDYVAFTGSGFGGRRIYASAASERFIDVGLELGGNDGAYVAADADLEAAVDGIVDGACYNAGQSCCAVERAYVHESLYDRFVEAAHEQMKGLVMGDPQRDGTTLGPMAQPDAPGRLEAHVADAKRRGAEVRCGGAPTQVDGRGRFFPPTLLTGVEPGAVMMREESFGPILPIVRVSSDEEARSLIDDSHLGLTASVWTRDCERAITLARSLEVGTVYMNQCDNLDPALPWTGAKDSGKGSTLSDLGFLHLTRPKAIYFKLPKA